MKINWGTSIVLAFVAFIVFILFFVVKTFTQDKYDYDLVSENYYQEELEFQKTINNAKNANALVEQVSFQIIDDELIIVIPNKGTATIIGAVQFKRPSNDKLDFTKAIETTNGVVKFTHKDLVKGRWNVAVSWYYSDQLSKEYYKQESIYY